MDHITTKLQGAAEDLKKCLENVLHEDDLNNRAPSMTADHYESLKQVLVGSVGHRDNAILHWLQLSINSANDNQGNELILSLPGFARLAFARSFLFTPSPPRSLFIGYELSYRLNRL